MAELKTSAHLVGNFMQFRNGADDATCDRTCDIEVTDAEGEVEVAWDHGKTRNYLRFRLVDLRRAIKESIG